MRKVYESYYINLWGISEIFDSEQFLNHLRILRGQSLGLKNTSEYDDELRRIVAEKGKSLFITPDLFNAFDYAQLDQIIDANINRFFEYLPKKKYGRIKKQVTIGGLNIGNVNAAIVKHPERDIYVILINYGLVVYFVKFMSYVFAARSLDSVIWCNEYPKDQLSSSKIIGFTDELADNYLKTGVPHGPQLLLEKTLVDDITFFTNLAVQFVICHEIGHFLNGDCSEKDNFASFSLINEVQALIEDVNDNLEAQADVTAFNLLKNFTANEDLIIYGLYLFFIGLDWLYKRPMGGNHPNPIERFNKIIDQFYSVEKIQEIKRFLPAFTIQSATS